MWNHLECLFDPPFWTWIQFLSDICTGLNAWIRIGCMEICFYPSYSYSVYIWEGHNFCYEYSVSYNYLIIFFCANGALSYRNVPPFGRSTIHKFHSNASAMKKLAARDFEDLLQVIVCLFVIQICPNSLLVCYSRFRWSSAIWTWPNCPCIAFWAEYVDITCKITWAYGDNASWSRMLNHSTGRLLAEIWKGRMLTIQHQRTSSRTCSTQPPTGTQGKGPEDYNVNSGSKIIYRPRPKAKKV